MTDASKRSDVKKGQTPRDRDKQCDVCGVERIAVRGTDLLNKTMIFVGAKCEYMLDTDQPIIEVK